MSQPVASTPIEAFDQKERHPAVQFTGEQPVNIPGSESQLVALSHVLGCQAIHVFASTRGDGVSAAHFRLAELPGNRISVQFRSAERQQNRVVIHNGRDGFLESARAALAAWHRGVGDQSRSLTNARRIAHPVAATAERSSHIRTIREIIALVCSVATGRVDDSRRIRTNTPRRPTLWLTTLTPNGLGVRYVSVYRSPGGVVYRVEWLLEGNQTVDDLMTALYGACATCGVSFQGFSEPPSLPKQIIDCIRKPDTCGAAPLSYEALSKSDLRLTARAQRRVLKSLTAQGGY